MIQRRQATASKEPSGPPAGREAGRPLLEIQYHPGDIRRRVRYFFLDRRQVLRATGVLAAWLAVVVFGLTMAPSVVSSKLARRQYEQRIAERARLGERLLTQVDRLRELEEETDRVAFGMSKIYLAYGFDPDALEGQGGFPFAAAEVEDSVFSAEVATGSSTESRIREQLAVLDVFLQEVQAFETAHEDQVRVTPSISPLRGDDFVLTSPFAQRRNPFTKGVQFHSGIDLAAPVGTRIHAAADGLVAYAGQYPLKRSAAWWRYGKLVAVAHGELFITLYGHCDELLVKAGDRVKQGEVIATVGNTGWSTSPHLHYEVRRKSEDGEFEPIDPRIYILDHRWRDEERVLVRARRAPGAADYEPLPQLISR